MVVPPQSSAIQLLLKEFHDSPIGGHSGVLRTYKRISQQFYWPSMYQTMKNYVASCDIFQRTKSQTLSPAGLLPPLPIPCQVWDDVKWISLTNFHFQMVKIHFQRFSIVALSSIFNALLTNSPAGGTLFFRGLNFGIIQHIISLRE